MGNHQRNLEEKCCINNCSCDYVNYVFTEQGKQRANFIRYPGQLHGRN